METLVGADGSLVAVHEYGQSGWAVDAGISGLLGFALLAVAAYAAVVGRFSLVRITVLLGLVASA